MEICLSLSFFFFAQIELCNFPINRYGKPHQLLLHCCQNLQHDCLALETETNIFIGKSDHAIFFYAFHLCQHKNLMNSSCFLIHRTERIPEVHFLCCTFSVLRFKYQIDISFYIHFYTLMLKSIIKT